MQLSKANDDDDRQTREKMFMSKNEFVGSEHVQKWFW